MKKPIPVTQSSLPKFEDYIAEIRDLWDSKWLTNNGTKHQQLEQELAEYLDSPEITLFTNGHLALEYILQALNLTGEVITTPFTFVSTTHAIVRSGMTPVFCDINPVDYTMDAAQIEALITEKTSAIMPVHVYGQICDVEQIEAIAKKHQLKVIYDAAHAFGVKINGRGAGQFGDAAMFSFHATKVFNTIEGGAVVYKDAALKPTLDALKNFGITDPESVTYIGGNAKMNEFQAAMGLCNLRQVDDDIAKRRAVVERYRSHLSGVAGIQLAPEQAGVESNYAYFPVVFDGVKRTRDEVFELLKQHEIYARKYFYPLVSDFESYQRDYDAAQTPIARHIADCVLTLPLYAELELEDVDRICEVVQS